MVTQTELMKAMGIFKKVYNLFLYGDSSGEKYLSGLILKSGRGLAGN